MQKTTAVEYGRGALLHRQIGGIGERTLRRWAPRVHLTRVSAYSTVGSKETNAVKNITTQAAQAMTASAQRMSRSCFALRTRLAPRGTLKRGIAHPERNRSHAATVYPPERKRAPVLLGDSTLVAWYPSLTHLAREGRMTVTIGRRELLVALGGAAATWPLAARAQQPAMPVIGSLFSVSAAQWEDKMAGFRRGLGEAGFVDGRNVTIDYRWADGQLDRMAAMAADLIGRKVTVILAGGNTTGVRALIAATKTIPIVFTTAADPVATGLVASLSRPGGNATGVTVVG